MHCFYFQFCMHNESTWQKLEMSAWRMMTVQCEAAIFCYHSLNSLPANVGYRIVLKSCEICKSFVPCRKVPVVEANQGDGWMGTRCQCLARLDWTIQRIVCEMDKPNAKKKTSCTIQWKSFSILFVVICTCASAVESSSHGIACVTWPQNTSFRQFGDG